MQSSEILRIGVMCSAIDYAKLLVTILIINDNYIYSHNEVNILTPEKRLFSKGKLLVTQETNVFTLMARLIMAI